MDAPTGGRAHSSECAEAETERPRRKPLIPPRPDYETRVKTGALVLLVLTTLLTNALHLRVYRAPSSDIVTASVRRFSGLRRVLPRRGVVGYVSDEREEARHTEKYFLAGYALAPLILVPGTDRPLVVGDFGTTRGVARVAPGGLVRVHDFGNGVVLFQRGPR